MIADFVAKNLDWPGADEIAAWFQALQRAAQGGAGSAQGAGRAPNPADLAKAHVEAQSTALIEAQKLKLDAYKAETERMKVMHDINEQRLRVVTNS